MYYISNIAVPAIIVIILLYGLSEKKNVFDIFLVGAKDGAKMVMGIFPTLIGLFLAIKALSSSGVLDFLIGILSPILDLLKSNKDEETEIVNKITVKKLIESLNENEKRIIMMRYYRGKTQSQVAELLGISQVQVSRLEKKILSNMKNKLTMKKHV